MKLPVLYEREYRLAAEALLEAGECLERLKRPTQAAGLYRELDERFAQSPAAEEARRRLERLVSPTAARENER
jgi:TolA-binding protein